MRIIAVYRVAGPADEIEARADNLAVEQSVEMPVSAIADERVLAGIVGRVEGIEPVGDAVHRVRIALAAETVGDEPGQLMNMLFGNSSLHEFVTLEDAELPEDLAARFGGPSVGAEGMRARVGAGERAFTASNQQERTFTVSDQLKNPERAFTASDQQETKPQRTGAGARAMTCTALKPQGLPPEGLAALAAQFAAGGIDYIKDDHGLADQHYSPFAARVAACAAAVRRTVAATGHASRYAPNLSGHLDQLRAQLRIVREEGLDTVIVAPMVVGLPAFHAVTRENPDIAFIAHPAMGGAARIAPPLLIGKLFRLLGADAVIFPNHGGRFGYSPDTCTAIAGAARGPWHGLKPALPVPAGGMTTARLPELIRFYGTDAMILIGGALLSARERLTSETAAFVQEVARLSQEMPQ